MAKRFSKNFENYGEWEVQAGYTGYTSRIKRLHARYPTASLSQLRGHAKEKEVPLTSTKKKPTSKLDWNELTPDEKGVRMTARSVYFNMKRNESSLAATAKECGISPATVLRHVDGFKKVDGQWVVKERMVNEVPMLINSNGKSYYVLISDSRTASLIGRYLASVRNFLESGDTTYILPFLDKKIRASDGTYHVLDIRPDILYELQEQREDEEFYSIYKG